MESSKAVVETARRALARTGTRRKAAIAAAERSAEQLERMVLQLQPVAQRLEAQRLEVIRLTASLATCESALQDVVPDAVPVVPVAVIADPPATERARPSLIGLIGARQRRRSKDTVLPLSQAQPPASESLAGVRSAQALVAASESWHALEAWSKM